LLQQLAGEFDRTVKLLGDIFISSLDNVLTALTDAEKALDPLLPGPPPSQLLADLGWVGGQVGGWWRGFERLGGVWLEIVGYRVVLSTDRILMVVDLVGLSAAADRVLKFRGMSPGSNVTLVHPAVAVRDLTPGLPLQGTLASPYCQ
jgi:hypothetical protein